MRKMIAIALMILILCFNGTGVIASSDVYKEELDFAGSFCNGYAIIGKYDGSFKYGYMNSSGKLVVEPKFDHCEDFYEDLAVVGISSGNGYSDMKYGYIKTDGSYLFKPQFNYAENIKNGIAVVGIKESDSMRYGLIDSKGRTIVEPKYDYIDTGVYLQAKGWATIKQNSQYGLVYLSTGKIIEPCYHYILDLSNYISISQMIDGKEKYGILLYNGDIIEPVYDNISSFRGADNILCEVELDGKFGLLGADGKYVITPEYDDIYPVDNGIRVKKGNLYGYMNYEGKKITDIEFEVASIYHKGKATVKLNGKWGIINIDGTYVAQPIYDEITIMDEEIIAILNGEKKILEFNGEYKVSSDYDYMYPFESIEGASKVKKNGKEIIIDSNSKPIFTKDFDTIGEFNNGIANITLNGKVGYLTIDDKYLVSPIYDGTFKDDKEPYYNTKLSEKWGLVFEDGNVIKPISDAPITFKNDFGIIRLGNKQTYINKKGEQITSETFDYCNPFSDGMGRIMNSLKTNYVNKNGKLMSQPFDWGEDFSDGYACIRDGGYSRFIDKEGKAAFGGDTKYFNGKSFSNGMAAVSDERGKWGYIDTKGKVVIQFTFNCAFAFDKKLAPVRIGDKFGFIDKTGKIVIQPVYDRAEEFVNGVANVWQGSKYSYITSNGEIKKDPTKNKSLEFEDGIAPARAISTKDNRYYWGYIRKDGSWIIEPQFGYASKLSNGKGYASNDGKQADIFKDGTITWK